MLKENFIDKVTEICNTRKKLNLENCFEDIPGHKGDDGDRGPEGKIIDGSAIDGLPGSNGLNGKEAKKIGIINFRDINNKIILSQEDTNIWKIDDKVTNIKLLKGYNGDNARMNPIIFKDSDGGMVISKQYLENYDLKKIEVKIEKGNPGINGKNAICKILGKRGTRGIKGKYGEEGNEGPIGISGKLGAPGDVISNPEFDIILTDNICIDNICINYNQFIRIHEKIRKLAEIIEKEQIYEDEFNSIANSLSTEEYKCQANTIDQFTNFDENMCYNSGYCSKNIRGDKGGKGDIGEAGHDVFNEEDGKKGIPGHNGKDGDEIPNIDFFDKDTEILIGKYKSVYKNAETKKISLENGVKGDSVIIPRIIFKNTNKPDQDQTFDTNYADETNEPVYTSSPNDIIVYLDNSKGERGKAGIDGVCSPGIEGPPGEEGYTGIKGLHGERGRDGIDADKGDSGPKNMNPSYTNIIAKKYCFSDVSDGLVAQICLDDFLLSEVINSEKFK